MKKFLVTVAVIGIFLLYGLYQKLAMTPVGGTTAGPSPTTGSSNSNSASNTSTPAPTAGNSNSSNSGSNITAGGSGTYKNGTYTGSVADAYYGYVQVQAVINGGQITNVQFLQYPNDRRNSQMINNQAMPMLTQEAIQAQSANVNIISGATDTSMAFIQSLGAALQSAL